MLVFRTVIPLVPVDDIQKLIDISIKWIEDSQHYKLSDVLSAYKGKNNFTEEAGKEKFECLCYSDNNIDYACILLEYYEDDKKWRTEVMFKKSSTETLTVISIYCETLDFTNILGEVHKPYLIKLLDREVGFAQDGPFPTGNTAHIFTSDELKIAADIIEGEFYSYLPCIYISINRMGEYSTDIDVLSKLLSGVAHVFVEPNIYFSYDLKHITNNCNPYLGAVGIFFPDRGVRKYLLPSEEYNYKIGKKFIFNTIKNIMIFGAVPDELSYSMIKLKLIQKKLTIEHEHDSNELFEELEKINAQIEEELNRLKAENIQLRHQNIGARNVPEGGIRIACNDIIESYDGQIYDFILETLEAKKNNYAKGTRARAILDGLLNKNKKIGQKEKIIEMLKATFRGSRTITAAMENRLKEYGFAVDRTKGKHPKLYFSDYPQITCTVPSTGGDRRGGDNQVSEIKNSIL